MNLRSLIRGSWPPAPATAISAIPATDEERESPSAGAARIARIAEIAVASPKPQTGEIAPNERHDDDRQAFQERAPATAPTAYPTAADGTEGTVLATWRAAIETAPAVPWRLHPTLTEVTTEENRTMVTTTEKKHGSAKGARQVLSLPIPPSVNALWTNIPGKGRARSESYNQWREAAGWELRALRPTPVPGSVAIMIRAGLVNTRRDLDNLGKPLLDLLTEHRIIEDDAHVADLHLHWDRTVPSGRVQLTLWRTRRPQDRLDAEDRQKVSAAQRRRWDAVRAAAGAAA